MKAVFCQVRLSLRLAILQIPIAPKKLKKLNVLLILVQKLATPFVADSKAYYKTHDMFAQIH
jgi:hypothetical protein